MSVANQNQITIKRVQGSEIDAYISELAQLRMTVFREYPYLYEGSLDYEKNYLRVYKESPRSALILALDGDKVVGAATALPLEDEADYVKKPFLDQGYDIQKIYYFGESVLFSSYRGRGIGNLFFDARESAAQQAGDFRWTAFCAVNRGQQHPLRPNSYRDLHEFWVKRGYQKNESLEAYFHWQDIGDTQETAKPMIFWLKEWNMK
ncbi:MAG: GNAT family N-acetyltransferase [Bdellovibrionia bacterium]